ncbi:MAG TPA: ABC transporter permease [Thermoleophilia bacterium]|nr:ABC transporter permease [Thermoleophilia bacterium]
MSVTQVTESAAARASASVARRVRDGRPLLRLRLAVVAVAAVGVLTLATEVVVRAAHVQPFVFPPPSAVLAELAAEPGLFLHAAAVTLGEAAAGLVLGAAAALAFAGAATCSRRLDAALTPLVVASQTIPVIALAPLLVLWMGYGAPPRVVICALIAFFPMAVGAREGLRATDPELLLLMRSAGARRRDVFWRVRVPAAAPYLAAGLRTGITLSLVGAVVAEWTGGDAGTGGLGYLVLSASSRLATAQEFAAILAITCLGLLAYGAAVLVERRLCWWVPASPSSMKGQP